MINSRGNSEENAEKRWKNEKIAVSLHPKYKYKVNKR